MQKLICLALLSAAGLAVAGDLSGKWKMSASAPDDKTYTFLLTVTTGVTPFASFDSPQFGLVQLRDVAVNGDNLIFKMLHQQEGLIQVNLHVEGAELKGGFQTPAGDRGTISGRRAEATVSTWKITAQREGGEMLLTLALREDDGAVTGTLAHENGSPIPLSDMLREGNNLSFKLPVNGQSYVLKCTLDGAKLTGEYQAPGGKTGTFAGVRE